MYYSGEFVALEDEYEDLVKELLEASELFDDVSCGWNGITVYGFDDVSDTDCYSLYRVLTPYLYSAELTFDNYDDQWKDIFDRKSWKTYTGVVRYSNPHRLF